MTNDIPEPVPAARPPERRPLKYEKGRSRILMKRVALSILAFDLACVFLYLSGNAQDFLDATQFMLLDLVVKSSAALVVASVGGIIATWLCWGKLSGRIVGIAAYVGAIAASVGLITFAKAVLVVSSGLK